jgi:hypothetical protein
MTKNEYINKIKIELVMSNYLDGWMIKWYTDKLKQLLKDEDNTKKDITVS